MDVFAVGHEHRVGGVRSGEALSAIDAAIGVTTTYTFDHRLQTIAARKREECLVQLLPGLPSPTA